MKFESIAFYILVVFGFVGMISLGIMLHELSHRTDFQSIAVDGHICFLDIPNNMTLKEFIGLTAYYEPVIYEQNATQYREIGKYTEFKAYTISFGLLAIFFVCLMLVLLRRSDYKYLELYEEWRKNNG